MSRSYLHGSVGPYQSLVGPSELKRTLPDGVLKVFVGTWNMNGKVGFTIIDFSEQVCKIFFHFIADPAEYFGRPVTADAVARHSRRGGNWHAGDERQSGRVGGLPTGNPGSEPCFISFRRTGNAALGRVPAQGSHLGVFRYTDPRCR